MLVRVDNNIIAMSLVLESPISFLSKFLNYIFSIFLKFYNLFNFNSRYSENVITINKISLSKRYSFIAREILFLNMTFTKNGDQTTKKIKYFNY